jgi:hypothetical protein
VQVEALCGRLCRPQAQLGDGVSGGDISGDEGRGHGKQSAARRKLQHCPSPHHSVREHACEPSSECVNFLYRMCYLFVLARAQGPAARARVRTEAARITVEARAMRLIRKGASQGHGPALSTVHSPSQQEHRTYPRKTHACACSLLHSRTPTSTRTLSTCLSPLQHNKPAIGPASVHGNGTGTRSGRRSCTLNTLPSDHSRLWRLKAALASAFRLLRTRLGKGCNDAKEMDNFQKNGISNISALQSPKTVRFLIYQPSPPPWCLWGLLLFFFLLIGLHGLRLCSRFAKAKDGDDVHQRGQRGRQRERPPVSPSLA